MMRQHIPNVVTCCNLVCGCIATMLAFYFRIDYALLFIIFGAAFDFCDGLTARILGVSSPIGKELDSLADVVTFGVAPSAILFFYLSTLAVPDVPVTCAIFLPVLAFVMAAFSALRLAKFNLDTRQTTSFIGLPTPANALFWGALVVGFGDDISCIPYAFSIVLGLMFLFCWLLVCELPMFALKFKHWGIHEQGNMLKYGFIVFSAVLMILAMVLSESAVKGFASSIAVVITAYVLLSAGLRCMNRSI